jgi:hypothetical protein
MANHLISFEREFQLWSYTASHGQLLLRSPKAPNRPTRMDVLFTDVRSVELRTTLQNLIIEEANASEISERPIRPAETAETGHKFYRLRSGDWIGCVVAGAVRWHEDSREYGESSTLMRP